MGKFLDEIFMNCEFANADLEKLFKDFKVLRCDCRIDAEYKAFFEKITDVELEKKFEQFYEELKGILYERDSELLKLFTVRGMLLQMQLQAEIWQQ